MRRFAGGLLCAGALLASGVLASPAAATKTECGGYKADVPHETNNFTDIKAVGVSCTTAHRVLGKWATGLGSADPGFNCTDQKTSAKGVYAVTCTNGAEVITARDNFKAH